MLLPDKKSRTTSAFRKGSAYKGIPIARSLLTAGLGWSANASHLSFSLP